MQQEMTIEFSKIKEIINSLESTDGAALNKYIELDPDSPVVKFRIKPDVIIEDMPEDFDIDRALADAFSELTLIAPDQSLEEQLDDDQLDQENMQLIHVDNLPKTKSLFTTRILAEGDSWFQLPEWFLIGRLFPKAIATQLTYRSEFTVKKIARWGDTLHGMFAEKDYIQAIREFDPEYFVFSGGGNDLQEGLRNFVHDYSSHRPIDQYLTQAGHDLMINIRQTYIALFNEVFGLKPNLKVLVHGYDYPKPWASEDSQYIGRYLMEKHIPEDLMPAVVKPVIDLMNQRIKEATDRFPNATFVDCRGLSQNQTWHDDMHPNTRGYKSMTQAFVRNIQ